MGRVSIHQARGASRLNGTRKRVLNAGSGTKRAGGLHAVFDARLWDETRLDIDPAVGPDIVGSVVDMTDFADDASYDGVWCSHNLEHLYEHQVQSALSEFRRVLKPDGFALITSPDLDEIARFLLLNGVDAIAYTSPSGPIRAIDMLYGHAGAIAEGRHHMAHRIGFTRSTLGNAALDAGFAECYVGKGTNFDLWGVALMARTDRPELRKAFSVTSQAGLLG